MAGAFSSGRVFRTQASCVKLISIVLIALGSAQAAPPSGSDLWSNPCHVTLRHARSTADKEMNFFIKMLNKDMFNELKHLYPKNLKKVKGNCPKVKRLITPVNKAPNMTVAYQQFHMSMIELAVFLDRLKDMPIKTNTDFNFAKRTSIYETTKEYLKLTICEFNEEILTGFKVQPETRVPPSVNTRCLPKEADLSRIQMLDMQFFKKLKRFFKMGKNLLRNQRKKNRKGKSRVKSSGQIRTSTS